MSFIVMSFVVMSFVVMSLLLWGQFLHFCFSVFPLFSDFRKITFSLRELEFLLSKNEYP